MSKKKQSKRPGASASAPEDREASTETAEFGGTDAMKLSHKRYSAELHDLQGELVTLQRHFILHYAGKRKTLVQPDRDVVFEITPDCLSDHRLAR